MIYSVFVYYFVLDENLYGLLSILSLFQVKSEKIFEEWITILLFNLFFKDKITFFLKALF